MHSVLGIRDESILLLATLDLKGQFLSKIKNKHIFPLICGVIYHPDCCGVS